jgi:SAM-dependent methyltransferase
MTILSKDQFNNYSKEWFRKSKWSLSSSDNQAFKEVKSSLTYGEILPNSIEELLIHLNLNINDVFYDLGCGLGKMVAQVYLCSPAKKVIGVELTSSRFLQAKKMLTKLQRVPGMAANRKVDILQGDIAIETCSDATVVYMCSTCYPPTLINSIVENLCTHSTIGLRLISLKRLPVLLQFSLVEKFNLEMTWSKASPVYVYELMGKDDISLSEKDDFDSFDDWEGIEFDDDDWSSEG